jgi:hypothetical protein
MTQICAATFAMRPSQYKTSSQLRIGADADADADAMMSASMIRKRDSKTLLPQ